MSKMSHKKGIYQWLPEKRQTKQCQIVYNFVLYYLEEVPWRNNTVRDKIGSTSETENGKLVL